MNESQQQAAIMLRHALVACKQSGLPVYLSNDFSEYANEVITLGTGTLTGEGGEEVVLLGNSDWASEIDYNDDTVII